MMNQWAPMTLEAARLRAGQPRPMPESLPKCFMTDLVRGRGGELIEINVDGDDTDARRFYEAREFSNTEPNGTDPLLYYYRQL
jgi:hypothetical protein